MTSPAIKLAKECGLPALTDYGNECLERFYRQAQAQALRDAANIYGPTDSIKRNQLRRMAEELNRE